MDAVNSGWAGDDVVASELLPGPELRRADAATAVVRAYSKLYARRLTQRGTAFEAPLQNALLALLHYRVALHGGSHAALAKHLEAIDVATRPVLESGEPHSTARDVAGYTWSASYTALPMAEPPVPQIEWVFSSGSSGGVVGIGGVVWRALFLANAWHYFNFQHRRRVAAELDRRVDYLVERLPGFVAAVRNGGEVNFGQASQVAPVAAELAERVEVAELREQARAIVSAILGRIEPGEVVHEPGVAVEDTPTGHLAQFALAATAVGETYARDVTIDHLLSARFDAERDLISRDEPASEQPEISVWVPLGFLGVLPLPELRSDPSRPPAS